MKKSGMIVLLISIILTLNFVYAENLNLKITGNIGNLTSDAIIKTSSSAQLTIDAYDMRTTTNPDTYSQFYTTSTGTNLAIDSWNGTLPRTINLTFHLSSSQTGIINFSWTSVSGNYSANFSYFGTDSTYTTELAEVDMSNYSNYNNSVAGASDVYAQLSVFNSDLSGPNIILVSPDNGLSTTATSQDFQFTVSDANLVSSCSLIFDGSSVASISSVDKTITNTLSYSGISVTSHSWLIRCQDNLGNSADSSTRTLTITKTSTGTTSPGGGGGGGGGGSNATIAKTLPGLEAIPSSFNLPATSGITNKGKISLRNTGNTNLDLSINIVNLEGIVGFSSDSVELIPGKTEVLEFSINPGKPGIYTGKIRFSSKTLDYEVPVIINVKSESSLFDISLDLNQKSVNLGNKIIGQINLLQAGLKEKVDVTMNYVIKDFNGKTYYQKSETIAVENQKTYQYEFPTEDLLPGEYILGAEVIYSGGVATASSQLQIKEKISISYIVLIAAALVLVILVVVAIRYTRMRNRLKIKEIKKSKK